MPLYEEPPTSAVVNMRQFARSRQMPSAAGPYRVHPQELYGPEEHGGRRGVWTQGALGKSTPYCSQGCMFQHMQRQGLNIEHAEPWTHTPSVNSNYLPGPNQKPPTAHQLTPLRADVQIVRAGQGRGFAFGPELPEQTMARRSSGDPGRQHCANCKTPV